MELLILLDQQPANERGVTTDDMELVDINSSDSSAEEDSDAQQTFQLTRWYAQSGLRYPPWLYTALVILLIMLIIVAAYLRSWFFVAGEEVTNNAYSDITNLSG